MTNPPIIRLKMVGCPAIKLNSSCNAQIATPPTGARDDKKGADAKRGEQTRSEWDMVPETQWSGISFKLSTINYYGVNT